MAAKNGRPELQIVVEGMEDIIERDLEKHKAILERARADQLAFRSARSHEIQKKKNWTSKIGGGKFDDDALRESIKLINVNIRHFSDKEKLAQDLIDFETNIVDTLTEQLANQHRGLDDLAKYRRDNALGDK